MKVINGISLKVIEDASEFNHSVSKVLLDGKVTGVRVSGQVLEASVKVDAGLYILFITDNVIFEEALNIFLVKLGGVNSVIDSATIGEIYSSGVFNGLEIVSADSVKFHFMGGGVWTLIISRSPKWRFPFISEDNRISRPIGFKRYLFISYAADV